MIYTAPALTKLGILHGTADRSSGNMRLPSCADELLRKQGISSDTVLRFTQIHSDTVIDILSDEQARAFRQGSTVQADGWILAARGWGAAILTADCCPLLLWDESANLLGLAHCGWRGVAAGLPAQMARRMKQAGAQGALSAWVGPHIQACCFEVQADVAAQFPHAVQSRGNQLFVDLNQEITQQLTQEGLAREHLYFSPHCTCCEPENFFSFRRDHTRDALLTFVYLPLAENKKP